MSDHSRHHHHHSPDGSCCSSGNKAAAHEAARDPVCGMTVDRASARHFDRGTRAGLLFLLGRLPATSSRPSRTNISAPGRPPEPMPKGTQYTCPMHPEIVRDKPGSCPICGMALEPMGVPTGEEGPNPELVDFTRRLVGKRGAVHAAARPDHGADARPAGPRLDRRTGGRLDRAGAGHAGRAVGRPAVLPPRLEFDRQPQPQHVDADLDRRRRGLSSTASWRRCFPASSRTSSAAMAAPCPSISRRRPSSSRWSSSARCWNCGRASAPARRSARCSTSRRRPRGASATTAPRPTCRSTRSGRATGCACGRATACRSTAPCSKAAPRSTNR